jgi:hypothetical protein
LEAVKAWAELLAGVELAPDGAERVLSAADLEQRRLVLRRPENAAFAAAAPGLPR